MKEYRKNFFLTIFGILLAYFVGKLYDTVFTYYVETTPCFWVVASSALIIILGFAIYWVIYHDRKDYLKLKPGKE